MDNKKIEGTYKKTYEGEYIQSYGDSRALKKKHDEGVKSYRKITQTLTSYHKSEKGIYENQEPVNTVVEILPEGNRSTRANSPKRRAQRAKPLYPARNATSQSPTAKTKEETRTETPPPYTPTEEKPKPKEQQTTNRDYDIYRSMVMVPIISIGSGMYREMSKKEAINEPEARKILDMADYKPKTSANMVMFYLAALVLGIAFKIGGPIFIVIWGCMTKIKSTTSHEKQMSGMKLSISMPATENEKTIYRKRGNLEINVGFVIGIMQIIYYLNMA